MRICTTKFDPYERKNPTEMHFLSTIVSLPTNTSSGMKLIDPPSSLAQVPGWVGEGGNCVRERGGSIVAETIVALKIICILLKCVSAKYLGSISVQCIFCCLTGDYLMLDRHVNCLRNRKDTAGSPL